MTEKKISGGVESIEAEADKILEEARAKANKTILKYKEEAAEILSSDLSMSKVETKCKKLINKAKEEAEQDIKNSRDDASKINTAVAGKKIENSVKRIVNIVTGVVVE